MRECTQPPFVFRLARRLNRANLPGGYRLANWAARRGMLDVLVKYQLGRQITLTVPLSIFRWDALDGGARQTISQAETAVIIFEAHPKVAKRIGRDPISCVNLLLGIRPFRFFIAETGAPLATDRPLSESGWSSIVNIIAVSRE